mmetsp:Transcript_11439/g.28977  ORF Transcript_11439/g.28977 Transcript_11439/m.28977 type:complete len:201 (-) Transcript_11439:264-866(-)
MMVTSCFAGIFASFASIVAATLHSHCAYLLYPGQLQEKRNAGLSSLPCGIARNTLPVLTRFSNASKVSSLCGMYAASSRAKETFAASSMASRIAWSLSFCACSGRHSCITLFASSSAARSVAFVGYHTRPSWWTRRCLPRQPRSLCAAIHTPLPLLPTICLDHGTVASRSICVGSGSQCIAHFLRYFCSFTASSATLPRR